MEHASTRRRATLAVASLFSVIGLSMALAGCGGGGGGVGETPAPAPAPVAPPTFEGLQSFAAAATVIGQPGFTTGEPNSGGDAPTGATLSSPGGVAVSEDGTLLISDANNRRVLGFRALPQSLGQAADFVLGQPDVFHGDETGEPDGFTSPQNISIGAGKVAVVDRSAHRILIYDAVPTDGTARPRVVVGQSDLVPRDPGCSDSKLNFPRSVHITPGGKLIVADTGNSRVLIWKSVPESSGQAADVVLGQPDFDNCESNQGNTSPGRHTLSRPEGVWSDDVRLAVADTNNSRVLLWDELTMTDGQEPVRVLGQPNFDSGQSGAPAAETLALPRSVTWSGTHLAVSDTENNRVLLWEGWPSRHAEAAEVVLGQRDFSVGEPNDPNGDGIGHQPPAAHTLNQPYALTFHQDKLLVVDRANNRLLIYQSD